MQMNFLVRHWKHYFFCIYQVSNVMGSDSQHHDHHDSSKETPNFSGCNDDTMFTTSLREDMDKQDKMCRICYGGESAYDKLITPCLCSGSTKYAHETCLLQWITYKGSRTCELCLFNMEIHCKGIKPFWKVRSSKKPSFINKRGSRFPIA